MTATATAEAEAAGGEAGGLDALAFLEREGRLPALGDPVPPWRYRGFLLPYVIAGHGRHAAGRWPWYAAALEARRLPAGPIPRLDFGRPDEAVYGHLARWAKLVGWDNGGWSDFRTLVEWLAWGLRVADGPPVRLGDEAAERLYREVNLEPLLATPYDYLGGHVAQHKAGGWNPTKFYPTPHPVVECMVSLMFHDAAAAGRDVRAMTVSDPCVGSGRMLLHAANHSLRLSGQDIDSLAVAMTLVNGALYAPWMSFPLPEEAFQASAGDETPPAS